MVWNGVIQKAGMCTIHVSKKQLTISVMVCQVVAVTISVAMEMAIVLSLCYRMYSRRAFIYVFGVCLRFFFLLLGFDAVKKSHFLQFYLLHSHVVHSLSLCRALFVRRKCLSDKIKLSVCLTENMCENLLGFKLRFIQINTCGCSTAKLLSSLCHCVYVQIRVFIATWLHLYTQYMFVSVFVFVSVSCLYIGVSVCVLVLVRICVFEFCHTVQIENCSYFVRITKHPYISSTFTKDVFAVNDWLCHLMPKCVPYILGLTTSISQLVLPDHSNDFHPFHSFQFPVPRSLFFLTRTRTRPECPYTLVICVCVYLFRLVSIRFNIASNKVCAGLAFASMANAILLLLLIV